MLFRSQIEMRIFAHFADEQSMIQAIHNGVDLHTATAQGVFHTDTPSKAQRSISKNANFAKVYGAGVPKFALTARISEDEAQQFMDAYNARFPGVEAFAQQVISVARTRKQTEGRAYVRAPSGRIHAVYSEDDAYKTVNYLVQGTAADVFKQALVRLDAHGLTQYLRLPIHDEVIMEVPEAEVEEVRNLLPELMEDHTSFKVPIVVDVDEPADRWGQWYAQG